MLLGSFATSRMPGALGLWGSAALGFALVFRVFSFGLLGFRFRL